MKTLVKALDGRGWIGLASFFLTAMILFMLAGDPDLRRDDFFQSVAILLIGTSWVNGVVSWAYAATQNGGDLATRNAVTVDKMADKVAAPIQDVKVVNDAKDPAIVEEVATPANEELPPYAR